MNVQVTIECIDPAGSSDDIAIELPSEVMASLNLECGDVLSVEVIDGKLLLTPVRAESP